MSLTSILIFQGLTSGLFGFFYDEDIPHVRFTFPLHLPEVLRPQMRQGVDMLNEVDFCPHRHIAHGTVV